MVLSDTGGLVAGAVVLGLVHGIEPGHGWPVAASYALEKSRTWLHGFAASLLLGIGHLVSSIAMVVVFFWAKEFFGLTQIGWMDYVAGGLLIALGIREYRSGHSHGHGHGHSHGGHDHDADQQVLSREFRMDPVIENGGDHGHSHDHDGGSVISRILSRLPLLGRHVPTDGHGDAHEATDRGLLGIAGFAFVLGFAHEEEFEIIALCAGSDYCLELMVVYALTVILGIVSLTMLLIAGYTHSEERVERLTPYLPTFSAVVLVVMGVGFIVGVF